MDKVRVTKGRLVVPESRSEVTTIFVEPDDAITLMMLGHGSGTPIHRPHHLSGAGTSSRTPELVSETPAPLSAAKCRDAKRDNSRQHYDIRPSGTFLTLMSSWANEVKAFGTTSETGSPIRGRYRGARGHARTPTAHNRQAHPLKVSSL